MSLCKQRLLDDFQRRFPAAPVEELKSRQCSANTSTPPPVTGAACRREERAAKGLKAPEGKISPHTARM